MKRLGPYQIVGELGRSASSVVYHAYNPETGSSVALKTLRLGDDDGSPLSPLARLRNEARVMQGLRHPNLRAIYDAGEERGFAYLSMELVEGATLQRRLAGGAPMTPEQVLWIVEQLCQDLESLHAHGVTHCDLKPANILLTTQKRALVTDFGVACNDEDAGRPCVVATPRYLSPEQALGRPVDSRSDLYSLAVVIYVMLAGSPPFVGATASELTRQAAFARPFPIRRFRPSASPLLEFFFARALAKSPADRWPTSMAMARALSAALL